MLELTDAAVVDCTAAEIGGRLLTQILCAPIFTSLRLTNAQTCCLEVSTLT